MAGNGENLKKDVEETFGNRKSNVNKEFEEGFF
jgi:hypothetical protein